ncbi:VOC family protein [Streptomyces sp. J2-1]|uniref:VOC family protein n=1 Tax=Streptomyces corallincola TaxID=2851888 RepID=UPI001C38B0B0|nr:VOC family protein [Streptomyces corallincola]MBV2357739.1 VOC family protein [Streptomyces corallincola]
MAENSASPYPEGTPCRVRADLSDVAAGRRFYGALFGWSFTDGDDTLTEATLGGVPVATLARKTDGRLPTVWTVSFATPDAAALSRRITASGGQLLTPPYPGEGPGLAALAADPEGAVFGLWQPETREADEAGEAGEAYEVRDAREAYEAGEPDTPAPAAPALPETPPPTPGTLAWAQLYTRDPAAADAFYGTLFHDALFGPGARPDFGRAAVADVFPAEMPPHFLVHFASDDLDGALGAVRRLGGRVRVTPFRASYGRVAVVSDDQGASFALLQRTPVRVK